MHRLSTVALLAFAVRLGAQPTLAARVDSIALRVLAATGVPSASVAVVQHDSVVYARAYGNAKLDPATPAIANMRYGVGSISKQFTAAALLLLQQDGKLRLDDKVERWVPGLTRGTAITLRQVLSHTSGYQDFWPQDYVPPEMTRQIAPSAILARWAKKPLDFEPGSKWQYSNTNYTIAALTIEKASGMPFWRFVKSRILDPLGMSSAVDFDAGGPSVVEPIGYMRYGLGPLRPALSTGPGWMYGAGELAMTASDLAKWDRAMIERKLLTSASWAELERTIVLTNGVSSNYGLGVFTGSMGAHRTVIHDGEVAGFTADNVVLPDDSAAVIVLTNQDAVSASGVIANQIAALLFPAAQDALTADRTAQARKIFEGLQQGTIDRALFTPNANAYFNDQALKDLASSLGPLGAVSGFVQTGQALRGGMVYRNYRATFQGRAIRVWTYETPDGKLEQYQIAPIG